MAGLRILPCVVLLLGNLLPLLFGWVEPRLRHDSKVLSREEIKSETACKDGICSRQIGVRVKRSNDPFPAGVCYCNTFATIGSQCNPSSLGTPCNCLDNYRGDRCESCNPGYWGFPDCLSCDCNQEGATNLVCNKATGRCPCRRRIRGKKCNLCPLGHYDFPHCKPCRCSSSGSYSFLCDEVTGQCPCRDWNIKGRRCDVCKWGFSNFPNCWPCTNCHSLGTKDEVCDNTGTCICKENFQGSHCHECKTGHYGFPVCTKCACQTSVFGTCGQYGECICKPGYTGKTCESCADGYYGFPHCTPCECHHLGATSKSCDQKKGKCVCKKNIIGQKCDMCAKGLVTFPSCIKCTCNPAGTLRVPGQQNVGCFGAKQNCLCKTNVEGSHCDRCRFGYYNFTASNPAGCTTCACAARGTIAGIRGCHVTNGHCSCKNHVTGSKCAACTDGYYQIMSHDIFGCKACRCDPGGSATNVCHKGVGQCRCRPNIQGRYCNRLNPTATFYIPSLHHIRAELEDGLEADGFPVLSGSDKSKFPVFSGAGYVVPPENTDFTVDVQIPRTSTYRLVFHYALDQWQPVNLDIRLATKGARSPAHALSTSFKPTVESSGVTNKYYTVQTSGDNVEVELTKGTWTVIMRSTSSKLFLDFITLLPEEYYKASILHQAPSTPCLAHAHNTKHCDMYAYYADNNTVTVLGMRGFVNRGSVKPFRDVKFDLRSAGFGNTALLGQSQINVYYHLHVPRPGDYVLVVGYFQPQRIVHRIYVFHNNVRGMLEALPCQYQFACRQVVVNDRSQVMTYPLSRDMYKNKISLVAFSAANIGVISVNAIPKERWNLLYVKPFLRCSSHKHKCEPSSHDLPKDAVWLVRDAPTAGIDQMKTSLKGVVKAYGKYHMIIHYKQPARLLEKGSVRITSGVQPLTSDVMFEYCPTDGGCRVRVEWPGNTLDFSAGRVSVAIETAKETTVNYVLLVSSTAYSQSILQIHRKGSINAFIKHCSKDSFYISPRKRDHLICRDAAFTLTMHYNTGVFPCDCDPLGSRGRRCHQFGGQCYCKRSVVGRKCDKCMIGYTGFPNCRRCDCSPIGSVSAECDVSGRCTCSTGFGGRKCDRCASYGYYGYPNCRACNCDTRAGSLSMFCSQSGQCQCRLNFQGLKCDQCRVGYYDFPSCKQCNCNPAGIRLLPGQQNTCGNGGNDTKCTCKVNVQGVECEECKDLHFGLSLHNPLGCSPCGCNLQGSLGSISTCDKDRGTCRCKDHVNGRDCSRCADGYYGYDANDVFGCKRCTCNPGASFGSYCDDRTGQCTCLRNVAGIHCDRVESNQVYYPDLHHIKYELEDAKTTNDLPAVVYDNAVRFPGFSAAGYTVLNVYQSRIHMLIDVPRTSNYRVIVHYTLSQVDPVGALIRFIPTLESGYFPSGPAYQHKLGARFTSTATWSHTLAQFHMVKDSQGIPVEVLLSRGKWKVSMAAHPSTIQLDYLALLPEAYYRPTVLKEHVTSPCEVKTADRHCMHYRFPNTIGVDFVTLEAESGRLTGTKYQSINAPFSGVELHGQQNILSIDVPGDVVSGKYVIVASYFHDSSSSGRLDVQLFSGRSRGKGGWMKILTCRYTFGCRQFAISNDHKVQEFMIGRGTTINLYSSLSMAIDSITLVPRASWKAGYVSPAPQCVRIGPSCVSSSHTIPSDAVVIQAENSTDHNGHGQPRPPYLLDFSIRLAYIRPQQHSLYISSTAQPGRYYVLVHFFQPQFISFNGRVIVSSESATPALLNFRYCPFVSGCRAIGQSQKRSGMKERISIGRDSNVLLTIVVPDHISIWIDYVLLVPVRSYNPSLLESDPVDTKQDFVQDCARNSYFVKPSASQFCLKSVFSMTTSFNRGALPCDCDRLGSLNDSCQSYGGQCRCHANVVGRTCNRCKVGYRRVPNTRGCVL